MGGDSANLLIILGTGLQAPDLVPGWIARSWQLEGAQLSCVGDVATSPTRSPDTHDHQSFSPLIGTCYCC